MIIDLSISASSSPLHTSQILAKCFPLGMNQGSLINCAHVQEAFNWSPWTWSHWQSLEHFQWLSPIMFMSISLFVMFWFFFYVESSKLGCSIKIKYLVQLKQNHSQHIKAAAKNRRINNRMCTCYYKIHTMRVAALIDIFNINKRLCVMWKVTPQHYIFQLIVMDQEAQHYIYEVTRQKNSPHQLDA